MELTAGYKQTEVGVIPEDWGVAQIGDLEPFVTSGSRGWAAYYSEHGSPFIRITNLSRACIYPDLNDLRYVTVATDDSEAARTQLRDGDILISITADIGIVGLVTGTLPKPAYINQHIALVRFKAAETDSRFVSYFLASENSQKLFRAMTDSGAKAGMNLTTVQQTRIAFPPTKVEQEAIAEALSDADALIGSLEQLVAKKRHLKQGAMQDLLTGKKRLPGFSDEWKTRTIDSFSAFVTKGATPTTYGFGWKEDGVLFLRSECVSAGGLDLTQSMFISEVAHAALNRGEVREGDLLMTITGNVGRVVRLPVDFGVANINQHIARIRIKATDVSPGFVFHFLSQAKVRAKYALITTGQAYPQISLKQVRETLVPLPSCSEQTAIATVLSDMDAEIAELDVQLAKARTLKQGMMHKLLTGEIRLL